MPLGIDLGTTRTVVVHNDRGNYPVISFDGPDGASQPYWPATVAWRDGEVVFGLDAEQKKALGWEWLPSLKPLLSQHGPRHAVSLGIGRQQTLVQLLSGYLRRLRQDLATRSNLPPAAEIDRIWIAVPANADSNQRFLTLEGFRRAGFEVVGMLNEPSAAGVEYVHHHHPAGSKKRFLGVYDLGGGTFDAAAVAIDDRSFEVLSNRGLIDCGGNDFDAELLTLALEQGQVPTSVAASLSTQQRLTLLDECRERKEGLTPNTRRLVVDLGHALPGSGEVVIDAKVFYERCAALIARTLEAMLAALDGIPGGDERDLASVYLVGGSCALPPVSRLLRERFGRRIRRSAHPHAATAIGLAVTADGKVPQRIQERFTRNFGVWRERDQGNGVVFDPIFTRDTPLPGPGDPPLIHLRRYCPVHNIGHFRYLECAGIGSDGRPSGDLRPWDEIHFPMDPALAERDDLAQVAVTHSADAGGQVIEEEYACDGSGMIQVTIHNHSAGYRRSFQLRGGA